MLCLGALVPVLVTWHKTVAREIMQNLLGLLETANDSDLSKLYCCFGISLGIKGGLEDSLHLCGKVNVVKTLI